MPASKNGRGYDAKATPQHNVKLPTKVPAKVPLPDEKRNKVPDINAKGIRWYVCTTAPQAEIRAAESVRATEVNGIPLLAYVPCDFYWHRPQRGSLKMPLREFQRPRMRHYLFVGVEGGISDQVMAALRERDGEGRNRHGLVSILGSHMKGALAIGGKDLAWLGKLASDEVDGKTAAAHEAPFTRDEEVKILSGSFRGFNSRVLAFDAEAEEVIVELTLLGRPTEMRLKFDEVHKAA